MHTLAPPPDLTYKLGKHTVTTEADVLHSKNFYTKKMITLFFKYGNNYSHNK